MNNKVVLDVWVSDLTFPGYMDRWAKLAAEFEELHPDYEVKLRGLAFFTGPQEIATGIAEGNGPAIAEYYSYMSPTARDTRNPDGTLRYKSVEQAIGDRTEILGEPVVVDDIISTMRHYYTYQDDLTSMPSMGTTSLLFANKNILERAGITKVPTTWDEVTAACEVIAAMEDGPTNGITWSNHGTFIQQAIASQGGHLVDNEDGRAGPATTVDLATKEMLAFVGWWRQLHEDGHYHYTGDIPGWEGTFRAFAEQNVAFRISSSNDVNYMASAAENAGFELVVGPFPYNSQVPYVGNAIAGTSLWLADGLEPAVEDGALAFLQFIHNPRNAADRHKFNSFLPLTHACITVLEDEGWFSEYPFHQVATVHLATYPDRPGSTEAPPSNVPVVGDYAGLQDVLTSAIGDVLTNGADPIERLTQATEQSQGLLDAYRADAADGGPTNQTSLRVEYYTDAKPYSGADLENVVKLKQR